MAWLMEHWAVVTTVAGVVVALLNYSGKSKYAKVVESLVMSIEQANASEVKALAKDSSARAGVGPLLSLLVTKLTEGGAK